MILSPILKTFTSDVDKFTTRIGVFGRTFNEIATAIISRISDIKNAYGATDDLIGSFRDSDGILKRLYPSKKSIEEQLIDVETLYPEMDNTLAQKTLDKLLQQQKGIEATNGSWSNYFKNFEEGEKWQIEFVQNTDLQKASLDDVKGAYNAARQGAIAHNAALKQQTLSAKAANVALKGLSIAGNMLLSMGISMAIQAVISGIVHLVNAQKEAEESANGFISSIKKFNEETSKNSKSISDLNNRYQELSKGVDEFGDNLLLTADEYDEYKSLVSQVSDMMPDLTVLYNENGEKNKDNGR